MTLIDKCLKNLLWGRRKVFITFHHDFTFFLLATVDALNGKKVKNSKLILVTLPEINYLTGLCFFCY